MVKAVREVVSPGFAVAVKLNSADFQRGGFEPADARQAVLWLNELPVDLVELSGASYEAPAMQGDARDGRTLAREAYFLEFAREIAAIAKMPVMVTGGIRRLPVVEQVLASGVAMAGIATALAERRADGNRRITTHSLEAQGVGRTGLHGPGEIADAPPGGRQPAQGACIAIARLVAGARLYVTAGAPVQAYDEKPSGLMV